MDLSKATPQQISDYKIWWMEKGPRPIRVQSDFDVEGKDWCRRNLERWQWSMSKFTDVFEHTFFFENDNFANDFEFAAKNNFKVARNFLEK